MQADTEHTQQRSLNIFSDTFYIRKRATGGEKDIIQELPTDDNNLTVKERSRSMGPNVQEYPIKRDFQTIREYSIRSNYSHATNTVVFDCLEFDIEVDREQHPEKAEHFETVLEYIRELPELKEEVSSYGCYQDLINNLETVRRYETIYGMVMGTWSEFSLSSYAFSHQLQALERGSSWPRLFEIGQIRQGAYRILGLYHDTTTKCVDQKLQEKDAGKYSVAWGGFLVEPESFTTAHEICKPIYRTPSDD